MRVIAKTEQERGNRRKITDAERMRMRKSKAEIEPCLEVVCLENLAICLGALLFVTSTSVGHRRK